MSPLQLYYEEMVGLIYDSISASNIWTNFGRRLAGIIDATQVHIQALDLQQQAISYSSGGGVLSDAEAVVNEVAYLHYPVDADPRWASTLNTPPDQWYQCHHEITDEFVEKSDLFQQILLPINMRYVANKAIYWDEKIFVILCIYTSPQQKPLTKEKIEFVDKLVPHLKRAISLRRELYEYSQQNILGYALINKMAQPTMLLNLTGQIAHYNKAVDRLLEKTSLIGISNHELTIIEPYGDQLKDSLQSIERLYRYKQLDEQQDLQDGCIKVTAKDGENLYIFASLLSSELELKAFGMRPMVMLTFYHPNYTVMIDTQLLQAAFKLTPAECKAALTLLEGFSIKEISQKNKISVDTVKKQIQSIYTKTDTHKQSDLVKLLLNFPKKN